MASRLGGSTLLQANAYPPKKECPICHKVFKPVRETMFKIQTGKNTYYFCSWGCYRDGRKQEANSGVQKRSKTEYRTINEQIQDAWKRVKVCEDKLAHYEAKKEAYKQAGDKKNTEYQNKPINQWTRKLEDAKYMLEYLTFENGRRNRDGQ